MEAAPRVNLGAELARAGQAKEAVAVLREATELDPTSAEGFHNLGQALHGCGDHAEAAAAYRAALALTPDDTASRLAYGAVLADSGDVAGALSEAKDALRRDPASELASRCVRALVTDLKRANERQAPHEKGHQQQQHRARLERGGPSTGQSNGQSGTRKAASARPKVVTSSARVPWGGGPGVQAKKKEKGRSERIK